jgi:hypothetical protein
VELSVVGKLLGLAVGLAVTLSVGDRLVLAVGDRLGLPDGVGVIVGLDERKEVGKVVGA